MSIATTLKVYRKRAAFSQAELAKIIGVDISDIKNYENGTETPPSDIVSVIARACGVSVDEIFGWERHVNEKTEIPSADGWIIDDVLLNEVPSTDKKKKDNKSR